MIEGKALVEDSDMPVQMQIQTMVFASQALDLYDVVDCKSVAAHIKKVQLLSSSSTYPLLLLLLHTHTHTRSHFLYSELFGVVIFEMDEQEFDKRYGNGWQCVVGSNFGCFFTHTKGSFIYFTLETLNFLIFKRASSPPSSP